VIGVLILHIKDLKQKSIRNIPLNNVCNSISFRAKLDHIHYSQNYKNCTFLIAGSSMSLNNISGNIIHNRTNECVYNIASWGFDIYEINRFLSISKLDNLKYIFVAFNNTDFTNSFTFDLDATNIFLNGNNFSKTVNFIRNFNIYTFNKDWYSKAKLSAVNNTYQSLNFDNFGSVLMDTTNFEIDEYRWDNYADTSNFNSFYKQVEILDSTCMKHNIILVMTYLPTRTDLLNNEYKLQNKQVSSIMSKKLGERFINLNNFELSSKHYCDGIHFFKSGAEIMTNNALDTLISKKIISHK
jgi:hypothetical protein